MKKWGDRVPWSVGPVVLASLLIFWAGASYQSAARDVLRLEDWQVAAARSYTSLATICAGIAALGGRWPRRSSRPTSAPSNSRRRSSGSRSYTTRTA